MAWKKGESGNPRGRAAEKPFADALRMEIKAAGGDHQKLRQIACKLLEKAAEGDMQAINCLADRLDGRPAQALEVNTSETFVMRLPEPAKTVEEWQARIANRTNVRALLDEASKTPTRTNSEH
jgi:Family of unknown function (DUF5681)